MYLVGARFDRLDAANAAIDELNDRVRVDPGDLGLRPLGSVRYEQPASGLIVAGRFGVADVPAVVDILRRHGGDIVFRRAEWRHPRPLSGGPERAGGHGSEDARKRAGEQTGGGGSERGCARCQGLRRLCR